MAEVVRCLAVRQPWAWGLVAGAKDIENRTWSTDYRGPIVIQASGSKTMVNDVLRQTGKSLAPMAFEYGALIGVVDLLAIVPMSEALEDNPWAWGTYCWKVGNARKFLEPISAKGKLNLYSLAPDLAERALAAIETAEVVRRDQLADAWIAAMTRYGNDERSRYEGLLDNYLELQDGTNALRLAEQAVVRWGDIETVLDRGAAKLTNGDLEGALDDANQGIAMSPTSAHGYFARSRVYEALADRDFSKVQEIDPEYAAQLTGDNKKEERQEELD